MHKELSAQKKDLNLTVLMQPSDYIYFYNNIRIISFNVSWTLSFCEKLGKYKMRSDSN